MDITDTSQKNWLFTHATEASLIDAFLDANRVNGVVDNIIKNKSIKIVETFTGLDNFKKDLEKSTFNALQDSWLDVLRELAKKIYEQRDEIPEIISNKMIQYLDEQLTSALTKTALKFNESAATDSEIQKENNFDLYGIKGIGNLLYEFANGEGPSIREFSNGDFWDDFFEGDRMEKLKTDFENQLVNNNLTFNQFVSNGTTITSGYGFSPDHIGVISSIEEHYNANWVQFFVGGSAVEYRPSSQPGYIDIKLTNPTSRSSLLLHVGDDYDRNISGNIPLSTIKQCFYITIKII